MSLPSSFQLLKDSSAFCFKGLAPLVKFTQSLADSFVTDFAESTEL